MRVMKGLIFKTRLIYAYMRSIFGFFRVRGRQKIFVVGRNKTGTTSVRKAFEDLGYVVGEQLISDYLFDSYLFSGNYSKLIRFINTAEVFQDVPFSLCEFLPIIDKRFPGSKFILTVRDNDEQWYKSLTRFHSKRYGENGNLPTFDELERKQKYVGSGLNINVIKVHGTPREDPYNKEIMCSHYNRHNSYVINYFKRRPGDLLVLNLSNEGAYEKFIKFLGVESEAKHFPWENKT